ncbi:MAG TPA: hypothetical protein PK843_07745 [bacterium]|nr:hypothetical protein [bacterium]HPN34389.1 hypothetical protein [bacterium]
MKNIEHIFCSYREDLIGRVLNEQPPEATVFISPTQPASKTACRRFQPHWRWSATLWLEREEFKERCFPTTHPLLREEKRTLAFYASLSDEMRETFRIRNFFHSAELADHFFSFWEECQEAMLAEPLDFDRLQASGLEVQDWQRELYRNLVELKEAYRRFIEKNNFQDRLFCRQPECIDLKGLAAYDRFVFINLPDCTRLEKCIFSRLAEADKAVVLYHLSERAGRLSPETAEKPLSFQDVQEAAVERLYFYECKSDFSMMAAASQLASRHPGCIIVESRPSRNPYYRFFSLKKLGLRLLQPFPQTTIYRFLARLLEILQSVKPDQTDAHRLLAPLPVLLDALMDADFCRYVRPSDYPDPEQFAEQAVRVVYDLLEQDYRYVDLHGDFFSLQDSLVQRARPFLQPLLFLVQRALGLQTMQGLIEWIDAEDGVRIREIISEDEKNHSDILDVFYSSLADFYTLSSLDFLADWQEVFAPEHRSDRTAVSRGWLRLLLEYLNGKRIHFSTAVPAVPQVQVLSLADTRNQTYERVILLNLVEGVLPSAPVTPFLFNDHQRKELGLTTHEQVRMREKKAFAALIFTTPEVHLLARKNTENNVEVSSFMEELALHFHSREMHMTRVEEAWHRRVYAGLLPEQAMQAAPPSTALPPSFFTLPVDRRQDFADRTIDLSFYDYFTCREQPFLFCIRHLLHIEPRPKEFDNDFSPPFIGKIAHAVMNLIWRFYLEETFATADPDKWMGLADAYLERAFHHWMREKPENRYKIPQNHSLIYFNEIYRPILISGIRSFFNFLDARLHLPMNQTKIFPEGEFSSSAEKEGVTLTTWQERDGEWRIKIKGRADLRLETDDPPRRYIFDYKTGSIHREQLLFYELLYYLLQHPELEDQITSYGYHLVHQTAQEFVQLYQRRGSAVNRRQVRLEFIAWLQTHLSVILAEGFKVGSIHRSQPEWHPVIRTDLYQKTKA